MWQQYRTTRSPHTFTSNACCLWPSVCTAGDCWLQRNGNGDRRQDNDIFHSISADSLWARFLSCATYAYSTVELLLLSIKISIKMIMYANSSRSTSLLLLLVVINNCAPQSHCLLLKMASVSLPSAYSSFTNHRRALGINCNFDFQMPIYFSFIFFLFVSANALAPTLILLVIFLIHSSNVLI